MKRRAFRICALLLLGAIVNVAVAWSPCFLRDMRIRQDDEWDQMPPTDKRVEDLWIHHAPEGRRPPSRLELRRSMVADERQLTYRSGRAMGDFYVRQVDLGFPLRGLSFNSWHMEPALTPVGSMIAGDDALVLGSRPVAVRALWPGFAIDTVFYPAVLWGGWLLFAAPLALRRRRRIKHGLCPACAYPVGTSDKCTECGADLNSSRRTA